MEFGDSPIIIQNVFRIIPKPLNPIDMVPDVAATDERPRMIDRLMLPIAFQGLIAKGILVLHRPFSSFGLDMPHEFIWADRFDHFGVDAVFLLQKLKDASVT